MQSQDDDLVIPRLLRMAIVEARRANGWHEINISQISEGKKPTTVSRSKQSISAGPSVKKNVGFEEESVPETDSSTDEEDQLAEDRGRSSASRSGALTGKEFAVVGRCGRARINVDFHPSEVFQVS